MKKILFYFFIINIVFISFAEEISEKTTLFSYDIFSENDLYLALEGSWKFDLSTFASGNISSAFENLVFNQEPDLEASIWLFNKYFFETKITDDSDENIFILGYQNVDTLLQEVRIGNDDLEIGSYANYTPSINTDYAPGARVKIVSPSSQHEILTRYTSENNDTVTYMGYNYVEEESQTINQYVKEKFFILPFDDFESVDLYTYDGDSLTELSDQDYIFDSSENLLYIEDNDDTIYLSIGSRSKTNYKEKLYDFIDPSNNPGISDSISEGDLWDKYIVDDISDGNYIKLTDTGYSPFDQMGCYELDSLSDVDEDDLDIYLNGTQIINFTVYDDYIIIKDSDLTYDNLKSRYPFIDEDEDIYGNGGSGLTSSYILDFQELTSVSEITVPEDAKENSLSVTINGSSYSNFTHDSDSGVVTFAKDISTFDKIIINYEIDASTGTGNLLLSYGSRYQLNNDLTLDLSHTLSWDFSSDDYSYEADENVGSIISRGLLSYNTEQLSIDLETEFFASTPDTTNGYMLFEYDQSVIEIPVSSIDLVDDTSGGVSLIKRDYNDLILTYSEIQELTIDDSGGAYTVYHSESSTSSEVIVLETEELIGDDYSSVDIDLDDYNGDYSWATSFSIDIMNSVNRDLTFTFTDDDSSDDTTLTTIIEDVKNTSGYTTYSVELSTSDREKLTNLDTIRITINSGDEDLFLLKNIEFTGDSLVKHNGSTEFTVTESDSSLEIETTDSFSSGDSIQISSEVSSVNLHDYGNISFSLTNYGLLSDSNITITFSDDDVSYAELYIPDGLTYGENEIEINIEDQLVTINGSESDSYTFYSSSQTIDSFTINFDNCSEGSMIISEIILEDPVWDLYNQSSLDIVYTPSLSIKVGDYPILENITISAENNLIKSDILSYNLTGEVEMDLLGSTVYSSFYYKDDLENIEYKVTIPSFDSPVIFTDQFSYDSDRYRLETLLLDTDITQLQLKSSDTLGDDSGIRSTELTLESSNKLPVIFELETNLTQYRDDEVDILNNELSFSYIDLIPVDILDNENNLTHTMGLEYNSSIINSSIEFEGELNQENDSDKEDTNSYSFTLGSDFKILDTTISPSFSTIYSYINNITDIYSVTDGIDKYLLIFSETNPYKDLTFFDTFFSYSRTDFYDNCDDDSDRSIESEFTISLSHNMQIDEPLNIFIPKQISYSIDKDLSQDESLETSTLTQEISGTFTINSDIKNSITLGQEFDIEESETEDSLDWEFIFYKEIKKDYFLDISNTLTIDTDSGCSNITSGELSWAGKSGPLLIVPVIDKVFDSPYNYEHTEEIYLSLTDDISELILGIKHETVLTVNDINETSFYIDLGWDNDDDDKLSFELGLYTTLIF